MEKNVMKTSVNIAYLYMYVCETAYVYWFGNVAFINCEANSRPFGRKT